MRNVLVLGNGFDLAHNLPTAYEDFLWILKKPDEFLENFNYTKESVLRIPSDPTINARWMKYLINTEFMDVNEISRMVKMIKHNSWAHYYANCNAEIDGWIDFEREMIPPLKLFCFLAKSECNTVVEKGTYHAIIYHSEDGISRMAGLWPKYIEYTKLLPNGRLAIDITSDYSDRTYGLLKRKMVDSLKTELEEFSELFSIYLREIVLRYPITDINLFRNMNVTDVVTFNYTDIFLKYWTRLSDNNICYVHGSVNNGDGIIFGVDKVEANSDNLFIEFEKRTQRIKKDTFYLYKRIINEGNYELTIFGHSLDNTDKSILEPLIRNAKKVVIYCYKKENGESDQSIKRKNLVIMLGEDDVEDMLYTKKIEMITF